MLHRFKGVGLILVLLLTPFALTSFYYVVQFSSQSYSPGSSLGVTTRYSPFYKSAVFKDKSYVEVTAIKSSNMQKSNDLSIDLRVKPYRAGGAPLITKYYNSSEPGGLGWSYALSLSPINSEKMVVMFEYRPVTTRYVKSIITSDKVPIYPNKWTHVGLLFAHSHILIFVNGTVVSDTIESEPLGQGPGFLQESYYLIGSDKGKSFTRYFDGEMDELRVHDYGSLTGFWGYNVDKAVPYKDTAGPPATMLFHFDESSGCPVGKGYLTSTQTLSTIQSTCNNIKYVLIPDTSIPPYPSAYITKTPFPTYAPKPTYFIPTVTPFPTPTVFYPSPTATPTAAMVVNRPPELTVPTSYLYWRYNQPYSTYITAIDPDGDGMKVVSAWIQPYAISGLTFSCQPPTNSLTPTPTFSPGGKLICRFYGTPTKNSNITPPDYYEASITVTDAKGATAYKTFKIRFLN